MGSPISPIIADIVMQDLEEKVFNSLDYKIPIYYRHVDIFLVTPKEKIPEILERFNSYRDLLQFTIEIEKNRCLNFLDLLLTVNNNSIHIDWFHKKTYSGRLLSYYIESASLL